MTQQQGKLDDAAKGDDDEIVHFRSNKVNISNSYMQKSGRRLDWALTNNKVSLMTSMMLQSGRLLRMDIGEATR